MRGSCRKQIGVFLVTGTSYLPLQSRLSSLIEQRPLVDDGDQYLQFPPGSRVPPHFVYWRPPVPERYAVSPPERINTLRLTPSRLNLTGLDGNSNGPRGQTFIARRQAHSLFGYSVDIDFRPTELGEEAGITLFLSQVSHLETRVEETGFDSSA